MPRVENFESVLDEIRKHLPDYLSEHGINVRTNFKCIVPEHNDTGPSCHLTQDKTRAYCFGCNQRIDIFDAARIIENKPASGEPWFTNNFMYLANKYQIEVKVGELTEEERYRLTVFKAYSDASDLIVNFEIKNTKAEEEVTKRNWTEKTLSEYKIGTVPSYQTFRKKMREIGYSSSFLDEIGLNKTDVFSDNSLIFTWFDEHARPVGFVARNLNFVSNGDAPKYICQHSTGLKINILQKHARLFGLHVARHTSGPVYIFEGEADSITAYQAGIKNCVSFGGGNLREEQLKTLKKLSITELIICTDGDKAGLKKTASLIKDKFKDRKDFTIKVLTLPAGYDPDQFIREKGKESFLALKPESAFSWQLSQFEDTTDPTEICSEMIPIITNEVSPVKRELLTRLLATRTGISLSSINEELKIKLDERSFSKSLERKKVIDSLIRDIQSRPARAEQILEEAKHRIREITKNYDANVLSMDDFITAIDTQKKEEEEKEGSYNGFILGDDLQDLQDALCGEWTSDCWLMLGGKPNAGKSALLAKIAYNVASLNDDVIVFYHTIDDTRAQLIPRFVCLAEGSSCLTMNQVRNPKYFINQNFSTAKNLIFMRSKGYKTLKELAVAGKLIIKDITQGGTTAFEEDTILYLQDKYPDRKILLILDNFHKLKDEVRFSEEASKWKYLSQHYKEMVERLHISAFTSIEYTKLQRGIKPTNNSVRETGQLEYDSMFLAHLWNEIDDLPESYTLYHQKTDWRGNEVHLPRIEVNIGKNKISEDKSSFFLDFYPAASDYKYISRSEVHTDVQSNKELQKATKSKGRLSGYSD